MTVLYYRLVHMHNGIEYGTIKTNKAYIYIHIYIYDHQSTNNISADIQRDRARTVVIIVHRIILRVLMCASKHHISVLIAEHQTHSENMTHINTKSVHKHRQVSVAVHF